MPRTARAAARLLQELAPVVDDAQVQVDDLDGLGVYRTYRVTSATRVGLDDVIAAVADERIASTRSISNGVEVTFVTDRRADDHKPFNVKDAADLLRKKQKRTTKKTAAKKAAPKDAD